MATLTTQTVTNGTALTQVYLDYTGASISVAPGETKSFQVIASNAGGGGLPDDNIPTGSRYVKLKTAAGD
jgi:hypothetical protein